MKIVYAKEFSKGYIKLPLSVQKLYKKQEIIFKKNWRDPRLQVKKLIDHPFTFSFRVTRSYRVLFVFVETGVVLFATTGHHKDIYQ